MANMKVVPSGPVANLVVKRSDGHELSLSSVNHSCIEFNGCVEVQDHGWVADPERFMRILAAFLSADEL